MKTKVRNVLLLSVALVLALSFCLGFFGCGGSDTEVEGADYTLTFDENYKGGSTTPVGVYNGEFKMPDDPERDGYVFMGWYLDKDGTEEADFEQITESTHLYAGWDEREEGMVYLKMMYNLEGKGTYKAVALEEDEVTFGNATSTPSLSGYKFKGWYTDAACTTAVSSSAYVVEDTTLYASWYLGWKFEGEDTNVNNSNDEMRSFYGFSENGNPIKVDSSCSGGYYFTNLYASGCYIEFEIYSSTAVSDANISLQAALVSGWGPENGGYTKDITISSEEFKLTVNGTAVSYSTMTFTDAALMDPNGNVRTDFKLYDLTTISLNEGWNTVRFTTNNYTGGNGGTQSALAPMIDYMMLYVPTNTTLSMESYHDENMRLAPSVSV